MNKIYENNLGASFKINREEKKNLIALEINQVSFLIDRNELNQFVDSSQDILNHYATCPCAHEIENKMVIYKAKQTEIRMKLSYNQLYLLKDLLKGTEFRLSMDHLLKKYKIS